MFISRIMYRVVVPKCLCSNINVRLCEFSPVFNLVC